jgi:type IV secretory pathway VirB10-like protein
MSLLRTKLTPAGQMQLSRTVLLTLAVVVLLGVGVLALAQRAIPSVGTLFASKEPEPTRKMEMPDVLKPSAQPYADLTKKPEPPVAQPVARQATPVSAQPTGLTQSQGEEIIKLLRQSAAKDATPPPPAFGELWKQQQEVVRETVEKERGTPPTQTPPTQKEKPVPSYKKDWTYLAQGDKPKDGEKASGSEEQKKRLAAKGEGEDIIKPAKWAIPSKPLMTIYRSMRLTGKLLDSINTDIPASTIRVELIEDVLDKFNYKTVIVPRGSIIITQQVGKAEFGQKRVPLSIEQIEIIDGPVIFVKGGIGDDKGAAGVPGRVNAHIGQLLLATGINAIMQLGLSNAGGTPGRGQYYQNPTQDALQQAGQSVAQDVNSYTKQVLKVPPTIEVDAHKKRKDGTPQPVLVSISLLDNIQLNREPVIAR